MSPLRPDAQSLLQAARDTREVTIVIRNLCAAFGEVAGTGVVCSVKDRLPREIAGYVEMKDGIAASIARQLGAGHIGERLVVFRYPAPKNFGIPMSAQELRRHGT